MTYDSLTTDVAIRCGCSPEMVKEVLFHIPDVLIRMGVGDTVRTPLGVFRMTATKSRAITLPDGKTQAKVLAKTSVKLKPGSRLKRER